MKTVMILLVLSGASFGDENESILPDPPVDVTAMARAEYQRAEQDFAAGKLIAAEDHLQVSWKLQHNHVTLYDLALVHIKQDRLYEAGEDMHHYFAYAPSALIDTSNASAKRLLHKIAILRGHDDQRGRVVAAKAIAAIRAGNYNVMPELDRALNQTQDMSLFYWIVLGEYRMTMANVGPKKFYKRINSFLCDVYRHMLLAYFNGSEDLGDVPDARRLFEEIDVEYRRVLALEAAEKTAQAGRR